jgi:hypothetical protein
LQITDIILRIINNNIIIIYKTKCIKIKNQESILIKECA